MSYAQTSWHKLMRRFIEAFTITILGVFPVCLSAQENFPESAVGQTVRELITVLNTEDEAARLKFLKERYVTNDDTDVERRLGQSKMLSSQFGKLEFKRVVRSSDDSITVACATSSGANISLTVEINDQQDAKIKNLRLEMLQDDAEPATPLETSDTQRIIESLARELRAKYVFPEVGEKMASAVETSLTNGEFTKLTDPTLLAEHLTTQLREICEDRHLRVMSGSPRPHSSVPGRRPVDNHGFVKAEMLPGGIGYLKFDFFSGNPAAKKTASAAMNFLGPSRALIFDLRENGGGSPDLIAYLTSYLFAKPVHLNSFYNRPTDTTTESWTQEDVPGNKFSADVKVFVLTSSYTFSGAEEFAYNLKNLKRATIIGEVTGGGAHPVMGVRLGSQMHMSMPFARAINPVTKTNWEGVGVQPHIEVSASEALNKATELALKQLAFETAANAGNDSVEFESLQKVAQQKTADGSFREAAEVLEKMHQLRPENENIWFELGYALHMSGQLDQAIEFHQKAAGTERFAGIATYNLACAYALQKNSDKAFSALESAIELGFDDLDQIRIDTDLETLRSDARFEELIERLEKD